MIDKQLLTQTVERALQGGEAYLVEVRVAADNRIAVEIDSPAGVDIDTCVKITRAIEAAFDRDVEDYELEVGSCGLTTPFKVLRQYEQNVGNEVEVLTAAGRKLRGQLVDVASDGSFTVDVPEKVLHEGAKRPRIEPVPHTFTPSEVKSVKLAL